jgi:hypothetical protein
MKFTVSDLKCLSKAVRSLSAREGTALPSSTFVGAIVILGLVRKARFRRSTSPASAGDVDGGRHAPTRLSRSASRKLFQELVKDLVDVLPRTNPMNLHDSIVLLKTIEYPMSRYPERAETREFEGKGVPTEWVIGQATNGSPDDLLDRGVQMPD